MNKSHFVACLLVALLPCAGRARGQAPLAIGGFDTSRCAEYSVPDGAAYSELRAAIVSSIPGATFSSTPELTTAYLDAVDVLMITSGGGSASGSITTALTPDEQTALLDFVTAGGRAIIMVDNSNFGGAGTPAINNSFTSKFDVSVTGHKSGLTVAHAATASAGHPLMAGPYGIVSQCMTGDPGWFDSLGAHGLALAQFDDSAIAIAVIDFKALSPHSGAVVFLSDFNALDNDRLALLDNTAFALNALAYLATSPSFFDLGGGLAGSDGVPSLQGTGSLVAGTAGTLALSKAAPFALTVLFASTSNTPTAFKGGTLSTVPVAFQWSGITFLSGAWILPWTSWPAGIPSGFAVYFQVAAVDAAAIHGVSISNLLQATQP